MTERTARHPVAPPSVVGKNHGAGKHHADPAAGARHSAAGARDLAAECRCD